MGDHEDRMSSMRGRMSDLAGYVVRQDQKISQLRAATAACKAKKQQLQKEMDVTRDSLAIEEQAVDELNAKHSISQGVIDGTLKPWTVSLCITSQLLCLCSDVVSLMQHVRTGGYQRTSSGVVRSYDQ